MKRPQPPTVDELLTALIWCSQSADFRPGGCLRWRWARSVRPLIIRAAAADGRFDLRRRPGGARVPGLAKPLPRRRS